MFDFTDASGGILQVGGNLIGGLLPLILIFVGLFIGLMIFKSLINFFKGQRVEIGVKKKVKWLEKRGYGIAKEEKAEKREREGLTQEKKVISELKKLGYFVIKK